MNQGQSTGSSDRLVAEALSCVRGGRILFRDLTFALEPGQAGLLAGPNGVGKSSLLRLIAGLLKPSTGSCIVPETRALCDDRLALDEHLPLDQALRFWAKLDGSDDADVTAAMARAGLSHLAEVPVRYFSTGQRQRARLARTYLTDARLWLLDEPANGLDTDSVARLGTVLQDHLDNGGIILAASHIPLPIGFDLTLKLEPLEELEACL
ncbi:heme ABC exporter ATP-binding protein CcmA [Parasphingorhabdus flavimaris]|jgi:heme exporter protein A|uniref:Heme ABC exporter ATP-binding protein CcmA n=1 Tax=Parasphingorhabdus flavimaris TaxID=266812 RepID=A0ABX2N4C4_9SPHN|nr:heme ABC exporter ATP-binding protein CcmA [Parasphingorhabdus flavimaris]NVD28421.1 heme ABC exporter ATP-binding protein CcmA [Parasphingorhabdus flavimaris]|tara:strand:- start:1196 stop:1822 length:627 start_codon:yes stop_codon:yes gene_type:complete